MTDSHEDAPCGLLRLSPDWRVQEANRYFRALLDPGPEALPEAPRFLQFLSLAGRVLVQTKLGPQLIVLGELQEIALDLLRADGERVPVILNATQRRSPDGVPGEIRIAMFRAAAKRAYEAEVPKAREDALAAHVAKRAAEQVKGDFLANISHEIRTPLNGVIGVASVLAGTSMDASQRQMVAMIEDSGRTLERLVSDLLDLSKIDAAQMRIEPHPFDLHMTLVQALEPSRVQAQNKGLRFTMRLDDSTRGEFQGDSVRLKQVLANLASNAVKFTPAGSVEIAARIDRQLSSEVDRLEVEVRDTGVGFDGAVAAQLFQRFRQADNSTTRMFGGSGLGLAISRDLVELMGGSIDAESEPGRGSVFRLRLPVERSAELVA
jgi:signal transduction histidine kinase